MTYRFSRGAGLVLVLALPGCWWTAPADDAGDAAWVMDTVPVLLGRKVRNSEELAVLVDIASTVGREEVVELLLEQPAYVDHWSHVLLADLQIRLIDEWDSLRTPLGSCFGEPLLAPGDRFALAEHLAVRLPASPFCVGLAEDEPPGDIDPSARMAGGDAPSDGADAADADAAGGGGTATARSPGDSLFDAVVDTQPRRCPPFNMTDVALSAVDADDVLSLYRAWLVPLTVNRANTGDGPSRVRIADRFLKTYLGRDTGCLACHSSSYSTTDGWPGNDNWDRFEGYDVDLEGAVFSNEDVTPVVDPYGGYGGDRVGRNLENLFNGDGVNPASGGTSSYGAWGMVDQCVKRNVNGTVFDGARTYTPSGSGRFVAVADMVGDHFGVGDLIAGMGTSARTTPASPAALQAASSPAIVLPSPTGAPVPCAGCHSPSSGAPDLCVVLSQMAVQRVEHTLLYGKGNMPAQAATVQDARQLVADARAYYAGTCNSFNPVDGPRALHDPRHGVTLLMALHIVDNIVQEAMGSRLTVLHGFARNEDQGVALQDLTSVFLDNGWSLKAVLREIVLSEGFGRRAPPSSGLPDPYALQPLAYPWAEPSPAETGVGTDRTHNSQGDMVHRASVETLVSYVEGALGWPGPRGLPRATGTASSAAYPGYTLHADIGGYTQEDQVGTEFVTVQNLAAWESAVASCTPAAIWYAGAFATTSAPASGADWIDALLASVTGTDTLEDVAIAIKDRLLTETTLEPAEASAIADFLGVGSLTTTWGAWSPAGFTKEALVRGYCGVLMKTGDFMLEGFNTVTAPPAQPPELLVCLSGEACTFDDICDGYEVTLQGLGSAYACPP